MTEHPLLWFMGNSSKPIFTQARVLELAGARLTPTTLQNWANRALVAPLMSTKDRRGLRRYDTAQLANIVLGLPLIEAGFSPTAAMLSVQVAYLKLMRNLVDTSKAKAKADSIPLNKLEEWFAVVPLNRGGRADLCEIVHVGKLSQALVKTKEGAVVLPFGRLIQELAIRAQAGAEEES